MMTIPINDNQDSGLLCLLVLCRFHDKLCDGEQIKHDYHHNGKFSAVELCRIAKDLGLKAELSDMAVHKLMHLPLPLIAEDVNGNFFIISQVENDTVTVYS